MVYGTLEQVIIKIQGNYIRDLCKRADYGERNKDCLPSLINEKIIIASLANRIGNTRLVDDVRKTYSELINVELMAGYVYKMLGMVDLATGNPYGAIQNFRESYERVGNLGLGEERVDIRQYIFLISNAKKISMQMEETTNAYRSVTETVARDIHLLGRSYEMNNPDIKAGILAAREIIRQLH